MVSVATNYLLALLSPKKDQNSYRRQLRIIGAMDSVGITMQAIVSLMASFC